MLDDLFDYCFPILDKIGHKLDRIEDDMFEGAAEDVVRDISNVKQEIISYRKVIKPERSTLRVLERRIDRFLPEELELYFDDINDAVERIWDQLDNYKEVVEALESTNESVISHRQNDVLRLLTLISVTMLPLTLLTGIFGMNVLYPGEATTAAFWVILGGARRDARRDGRLLPLEALALGVSAQRCGFRRVCTRILVPRAAVVRARRRRRGTRRPPGGRTASSSASTGAPRLPSPRSVTPRSRRGSSAPCGHVVERPNVAHDPSLVERL